MSERRKKNPRFIKETSDRSGFDNWSRTDEGNFIKKWQSVKQGGLLLEPEEFDQPPPSNKSLGGADISGTPSPYGASYDTPTPSEYQVQYLGASDTINVISQSPIMISGSNSAITAGGTPVLAYGTSNGSVSLLCVGSNVTIVRTNSMNLLTGSYTMDSGAILNLRFDTSNNFWHEISRSHQYYSLGAL